MDMNTVKLVPLQERDRNQFIIDNQIAFNMDSRKKTVCKVLMLAAYAILYIGAMEMMPSDGTTMTRINIWHGVMSFGGMLLIFLTYCLYATLSYRGDKDGAFLIICLLVFTLISGAFAVLNVFDDSSYVIASAVAEIYILMMFNIIGYLTYYEADSVRNHRVFFCAHCAWKQVWRALFFIVRKGDEIFF